MNRRKFIKHISVTTAGIVVSPMILNACSSNKRMNILFIMSDDHAYQAISRYGSILNLTPNIDKLANEGMLFEQSFVTNSICGPSRACMLTGKYNHINGMIDNRTTFDGDQQTFVKLLKQNGYRTAIVGKWHLKSDPTGFDYWNILPGQGEYYNPDFIEMGEKKRIDGYVTDITTDIALQWLDKQDNEKPFCLLLHHKAPHRNWLPSSNHIDMYDDKEMPIPKTFFDDYKTRSESAKQQTMKIDKDMFLDYDLKVPVLESEREKFIDEKLNDEWWKSSFDRLTDEQKSLWNKAYEDENNKFKNSNLKGEDLSKWKYQRFIKDYLRCIASVDDNVGRVFEYLKDNNLEENTIVVYTSDQGFYLGEHGWFDKRFMYEQSLRTPLIIKVPNGEKGIMNNENMVVNIDYAPTFLDYANVPIPNDMQGNSLRKILEGENPKNWRTSIYYHYFEYPAEHGVKRHYGIRNSRFKLIHFYYDIDAWEFYDLEKDPDEINNVYENSDYQAIIKELKIELQNLREKYKDTDETKFLPKKNQQINHKGIGAKITFEYKYDNKYLGGNHDALLDGLLGPSKMISNVDLSIYQGFQKNDLIATIDFMKEIALTKITIGFLQYLESWIFLPEWVEMFYLNESNNFISLDKIFRKSNIKSTLIFKENFISQFSKIKTNKLKVHAKNIGLCPAWHQGSGNPAWLFSDEIIIE
ncbi:MAG: sulfatase [Ignavibacteriae bacterium]|nr:sulfatase [Ignavibacteriota bacterium]